MTRTLILAMATAVAVSIPPAWAIDDLEGPASDLPTVLTPTRLRQSLGDVPASVTVITADMIRQFRITSVVEALKFVPGMAVTQTTGNNWRVNYHGTNILTPQRMNVLVDGRTVYRARLSSTDWGHMPVDVEDVERIEVTRGPNSATYGANSMMAIINIITRHPVDAEGTSASARLGSNGLAEGHFHHGGRASESTSYRLTATYGRDDGYDHVNTSKLNTANDSIQNGFLELRSTTDLGARGHLDAQISYLQGVNGIDYMDSPQTSYPNVHMKQVDASLAWATEFSDSHSLKAQVYVSARSDHQPWTTCPPPVAFLPTLYQMWGQNPYYANALLAGKKPTGGTPADDALAAAVLKQYASLGPARKVPICVDSNQNSAEARYEAEVQDTLVLSPQLRVASGAMARFERFDSQPYFNGQVISSAFSVFANAEYKPVELLTVSAGGYFEHDRLSGDAFSPRLALNLRVTSNSAIRAIYAESVRSPTAFEQRSDWSYVGFNAHPTLFGQSTVVFYAHAKAPVDALEPERMRSAELGYVGVLSAYGLNYDLKVFKDRMSHLISEKLNVYRTKPITNSNWTDLQGSELQLSWTPNANTTLWATYTYLLNDASIITEQTQYARHSGSVGLSHAFTDAWRGSLFWWSYGAPYQPGDGQTYIGHEDVTLSYNGRMGASPYSVTLAARHLDNPRSTYWQDYGSVRVSSYNSQMQYSISGQVSF